MTVLGKRRIQYEEELAYDGTNYDAWFSLARLEEDAYRADKEDGEDVEPTRVREVYERAVANIPPATEKRYAHLDALWSWVSADHTGSGADMSYVSRHQPTVDVC